MINDLAKTSASKKTLDVELMEKWQTFKDVLLTDHISKVVEIDITTAYRYIGDFEGLLVELGVNNSYLYPTMVVNNISSSIDYDGTKKEIILLDPQGLNTILKLI
jgi:hypothetical protein